METDVVLLAGRMSKSGNQRIIILELTPHAHQRVKEMAREVGTFQKRLTERIIEWFALQSPEFQEDAISLTTLERLRKEAIKAGRLKPDAPEDVKRLSTRGTFSGKDNRPRASGEETSAAGKPPKT